MLTMWTIYKSPRDYSSKFVLRAFDVGPKGPCPRDEVVVADTLDEIRKAVPPFLYRMPREPNDDPAILETWF